MKTTTSECHKTTALSLYIGFCQCMQSVIHILAKISVVAISQRFIANWFIQTGYRTFAINLHGNSTNSLNPACLDCFNLLTLLYNISQRKSTCCKALPKSFDEKSPRHLRFPKNVKLSTRWHVTSIRLNNSYPIPSKESAQSIYKFKKKV